MGFSVKRVEKNVWNLMYSSLWFITVLKPTVLPLEEIKFFTTPTLPHLTQRNFQEIHFFEWISINISIN